MAIELTTATAETLSGIREALSISTSSKPAKDEADVLNLRSYRGTIMGNGFFPGGSKFQSLLDDESSSLNFSIVGGSVNSSPICPSLLGDLASITVNSSNVETRDDGYGVYFSNYITYLNRVFEKLGLYSTLRGAPFGDIGAGSVIMKYYRSENFDFIFKEIITGDFPIGTAKQMTWIWSTFNGLGVCDNINEDRPDFTQYNNVWSGSITE
jgi:hypothetical protein